MQRIDVKTGQFAFLLFGIEVQCHAGDRVPVDLEDVEVADVFLDAHAGASDQLLGLDRLLRQHLNGTDVLFHCPTDLLIFVGINQGADTFVGKYLGKQTFIHASVDDVDALHSGMTGGGGVNRLGKHLRQDFLFLVRQNRVEVRYQHLADELALPQ